MRRLVASAALTAAMLIAPLARAADVTVFAAASLGDALQDIGAAYRRSTGHTAAISCAASSVLARQIENSQGADVFMSADSDWMDYLDRKHLLASGTRENLLGNRLVLIAPAASKARLKIAPAFDIAGALGGGRLALADPQSVPAGRYAKAALTKLGAWNAVKGRLAPAENVRVALAYVARGETPLGIVYATDAKAEPRVRVVDTFTEDTHPPIVYPVALTKDAKPLAREFESFLSSPAAARIFQRDGFSFLSAGGNARRHAKAKPRL